jgi:hypothetical protein
MPSHNRNSAKRRLEVKKEPGMMEEPGVKELG